MGGGDSRGLEWTARQGLSELRRSISRRLGEPGECRAFLAAVASAPDAPRSRVRERARHGASPANIDVARKGLADPDPLVDRRPRHARGVPAAQAWQLVSPLLSDPVGGVRIRAASAARHVPPASLPPVERERQRAAAEFMTAQRLNADRPEARATLGNFHARRGATAEAEAEYRAPCGSTRSLPRRRSISPIFYRRLGREADGETCCAPHSPRPDAAAHHALGLTLIRLNRRDEALDELREAASLPEQPRGAYVYAVGLHSTGRAEAISVLKDTLRDHPVDRDILQTLVAFSRDAGRSRRRLAAERLRQSAPTTPSLPTGPGSPPPRNQGAGAMTTSLPG